MFGGVIDRDIKDDLESRFCNDLYSFDVARRRWFPLEVKPPGGSGAATSDRKPKRKPRTKEGASTVGGDSKAGDSDDEFDVRRSA